MVDSLTPLASVTLKLSLDLDTVPPLEFTLDMPFHTATGLLRELMDSATTARGLLSQDTAMVVATSSSPVALEVPQDLSDTSTEFTPLDTSTPLPTLLASAQLSPDMDWAMEVTMVVVCPTLRGPHRALELTVDTTGVKPFCKSST